jgi:hypothetical protein
MAVNRIKKAFQRGVSQVEYNELPVKKTLLISVQHDRKLKVFCKVNRISVSQLFRLFVDELNISCNPEYAEQLRYNIAGSTFKAATFVGGMDPQAHSREFVVDGRSGAKQQKFWSSGSIYHKGR